MATKQQVEALEFDDLFDLPEAPKPQADLVDENVALTDEQRGALAARDRLAKRMEADATQIDVVHENIALRLMEGGVIVDIDIHRWTGTRRLLPEELGIKGKTRSKAIRLGEKLLMPPTIYRTANSLTTQLRTNLERNSFRTVWGRWIPATAYSKWKTRHDELAKEYEEIGDLLAANLPQIIEGGTGAWGELRRLYAEHARAAWCRINHYPVEDSNLERCPASFVDRYIEAIFQYMPSPDEIRESFRVVAKINFIPLPSMLTEDKVRSQRLWEQAEADRQADAKRREAQEQMEADVRNHYFAQKREMIDEFLTGVAGEVYSKMYDVSSRALATMSKNQGKLLEPTLRQLRSLVEWGEAMNVADHEELGQALDKLRGMIERSSEHRKPEDIEQQLKAMGTVARSVLVDLNIQPEVADSKLSVQARDAVLGIGSRLSRADVAKARETLGTAELDEPAIVRARRGEGSSTFQDIPQL